MKCAPLYSRDLFREIMTRPMALRLSVTERCNLHCSYCMPTGVKRFSGDTEAYTLETLAEAVRWLRGVFNITKVRLTGGEPLLKKGVEDLIRRLASTPGLTDISMTTNGTLLETHATLLKNAGLHRLNVSLDTLNPIRFKELTGGDVTDTLRGISTAQTAGFYPIKINAVLQRSFWREDVPQLLDYAFDKGLEIRFIELMRTGKQSDWAQNEFIAADAVQDWLETYTSVTNLERLPSDSASRTSIFWRDREMTVGWITPQSHPFCSDCNRLRLDSRGRLRRCLMDPDHLPLLVLLETRKSEEVEQRVLQYVSDKQPPAQMRTLLPMVAVGG